MVTDDAFVREDELICTRRLALRSARRDDAPAIARHANDRQIAEMTARIPFPYTLGHAEAFLDGAEDELILAMFRREDAVFLGLCSLKKKPKRAAELGYWLGRPFWGQGLATEAAQGVIDFAFETLAVDCVEVRCRVVNGASRRVIQKCGFQYCGTGMWVSLAAGRVASENYRMDRKCWQSLKNWGSR